MRNFYSSLLLIAAILILNLQSYTQETKYTNNWGEQGISMKTVSTEGLSLNYSMPEISFEDLDIEGEQMKSVKLPGVFLPNNAGAPDLPGISRYVAIPQGANVTMNIISSRTEVLKNQNIAPAPVIPLDTDPGPMHYEKDSRIYSTNGFYPENPVIISKKTEIRGVDVVMLGITPFQYNPVTKELIIYRDMEVELVFDGGNGIVGEQRLRSRWWDPIVKGAVINADIIPEIDFNLHNPSPTDTPDFEYLIISPDQSEFLAWADSIKKFRTLQGIKTGVVTTTDIGGNTTTAIETYVNNAYNSWSVPPSAVLILGDYSTGTTGITSYTYTHPASYPDFVSDNRFADVSGNELPDIVFARITANNASQLEVMISKFLDYERNPPTNPDFYDHPITALGWQTERWFQICSEVVGGYLKNSHGKNPVRINAVYSGNPSTDAWSSASNTTTVLNYFGPNGLGYIPATPQELGGFSGGTGSQVINAINDGSYLLQHRDHGNYSGWGEPSFNTSSINSLNNVNNELPFIFSINCQTGAFHRSSECFAEKFHRHTYGGQNSGALGLIAATEVSYSFVNDTYVWGVFDNLHPDFMPGYSTQFPNSFVMPAFGNAAGKHFLSQSSWPYNSGDKQITYRLFHHHGDAFMTLYTEVPQNLTVSHLNVLQAGLTSYSVTANSGAFIALTVNEDIIGTANGTGSPVNITIPAQNPGDVLTVTVTQQNYYRYSSNVEVATEGLFAQFSADNTTPCLGESVNFTDLSFGSPTSWNWSFPGGSPNSYSGQYPPAIQYNSAGTYDVILSITDGTETDIETKTGYITVSGITADFMGSPTTVVTGNSVSFTDNTSCNPISWSWSFPGGTPSSSSDQNPVITYNSIGSYSVTLVATNASATDTRTKTDYVTVSPPNYCSPTADCSYGDGFTDFIFDDISNLNSGCSSNGYGDFTNMSTNIEGGKTYTIQWETDYSDQDACLWIDFDYDGEFEDSERLITDFNLVNVNQLYSVNIDIPADAPIGERRLRIRANWQNSSTNPCGDFSYGETEDYTVIISSPAVEAGFIATPTTICEVEEIQFTDQSTGDVVSWAWEFEGGTPANSSEQNPSIKYNNSGSFDVSLTVQGSNNQDLLTKTNFINVNSTPAKAATPQGLSMLCQGTSQSTYTTSGAPGATSYQWMITPPTAAVLSGIGNTILVYWSAQFSGEATLSVIPVNACGNGEQSDPITITVNPTPQLTCPADFSVCINEPEFIVSGASPTGGTYTGSGMVSDKFFPDVAGEGTHEIIYTWADGAGCESECNFYITVNPLPSLICPGDFAVCIDYGSIDLSLNTSPQGGVFEGTGMEGNYFNSQLAGQGIHQITYEYTETNGCTNTCSFFVTVNSLPDVICPPDIEACINEVPFDLMGASPSEGIYSGTGVINNVFDPAMAGPGIFEIFYTYLDESGCENDCFFSITVNPLPEAAGQISGSTNVCQGVEIDYSTEEIVFAESYEWILDPAEAGTITNNGNSCSVLWDENYAGDATLVVSGVNFCGNGEWSVSYSVAVFNCNATGLPPGWDFSLNSSQHTILIPSGANPNIFGEHLQAGDFIGVFHIDNGVEKCAGAIEWFPQDNKTIMAFGDDVTTPEKDGFDIGEFIIWKLYDISENEEHPAITFYDNTFPQFDGTFEPFGLSKLISLQAFLQQSLILPEGWSGFSLPMIPLNPDLYEIFADIINELIILQNNDYVFWPLQGVNTFPGWTETIGAQIKMSQDVMLTVPGIPEEENDIILPAGWSFLPISSQCNIDADDLFMPFIDKLDVVKSVASFQVYWPAMSIYTLSVLEPGVSYLIKLSEPVTLVFPECTDSKPSHEKPVIPHTWQMVKPTPATHMVMIDAQNLTNLQAGDFVGSFTENGICTGCVRLEDTPVALTIFGDDLLTQEKDGMFENEEIHFKVLYPETGEEVVITTQFDENLPDYSGQFKTNGISAFKESYNGTSGINDSFNQLSIYPNPTNGKFMVSGLAGIESLTITNMHGQEIINIQLTSNQSFEIDLSNVQKGVYFLNAAGQSGRVIRKIVVR